MDDEQITLKNSRHVKFQILVVDDDSTSLAIAAATLKTSRYEVVTVQSPFDAISTLRVWKEFDLVLTDLHMPEMNGLQLQKQVEQEFKLPVVVMSADDNQGSILRCLEEGAIYYIVKPLKLNDLKYIWQYIMGVKKDNASVDFDKSQRVQSYEKEITTVNIPRAPSLVINENQGQRNTVNSSKRVGHGHKGENPKSRKPKIVWTTSLQNRFLQAIRHIGLDKAVPKNILEYMNVPGLTRENIASHLQKYRLFLRKVAESAINSGNISERTMKSSFASGLPETLLRSIRSRPHRGTLMDNLNLARTSGRYGTIGHFPSFRDHPGFSQTRTAFSNFLASSSSNVPQYLDPSSNGHQFSQSVLDNNMNYQSHSNNISAMQPRQFEIGNTSGTGVSFENNDLIHGGSNIGATVESMYRQNQTRNDMTVNVANGFGGFNYSHHPHETSGINLAQNYDYSGDNHGRTSLSADGQGGVMMSQMQFSANNILNSSSVLIGGTSSNNNNAVGMNNYTSSHSMAQGNSSTSAQNITKFSHVDFNGQKNTNMLPSMLQDEHNGPVNLVGGNAHGNSFNDICPVFESQPSQQVGQVGLGGITGMVYGENNHQHSHQQQVGNSFSHQVKGNTSKNKQILDQIGREYMSKNIADSSTANDMFSYINQIPCMEQFGGEQGEEFQSSAAVMPMEDFNSSKNNLDQLDWADEFVNSLLDPFA